MKLAISNIAWQDQHARIYALMRQFGFTGLEIAPTKFCADPYDSLDVAIRLKNDLMTQYGFSIVSMQSLLFGMQGLALFESQEQRECLKAYLKKAIVYAANVACPVLVFGNPKNRVSSSEGDYEIAIEFFKELGAFAKEHHTCLCIEPNPLDYGTNFINNVLEANQFVMDVASDGFKMIIDTSTMLLNQESLDQIEQVIANTQHIHISLPFLKPLNQGFDMYKSWFEDFVVKVQHTDYSNYLSIEMVNASDADIEESLQILTNLVK